MPYLGRAAAQDWIERWDRQRGCYLPAREGRSTALIDAVGGGAGRPDPLVLDLGCGPGSLAVRLLGRLPAATVIAVDDDPVLLALGRAGHDVAGLTFADVDLSAPRWSAALGLDRPADAAGRTTALHSLDPAPLAPKYAGLAGVPRPGGPGFGGRHLQGHQAGP